MELSWIKVRKQGTMQGREKETPSQGMEDLFFFSSSFVISGAMEGKEKGTTVSLKVYEAPYPPPSRV